MQYLYVIGIDGHATVVGPISAYTRVAQGCLTGSDCVWLVPGTFDYNGDPIHG